MPRFALLSHDSPRGLHYDFLLEKDDVLKTWALPRLPEPGVEIECEALPDHRPLYLDYEGPITDGRGTVARWDRGEFVVHAWGEREIHVELAGTKLAGRVALRRVPESATQWQFAWRS